jgi:FtsP/CotA-like multicopper oxidase with cupredoxin domain
MSSKIINRRDFLRLTGLGTLAWVTGAGSGILARSVSAATPDLELSLKAIKAKVSILSGLQTNVWKYAGKVLSGDPASLQNLGAGTWLGPILRVKRGDRLRIRFTNQLTQPSIVHWHGLHLPPDMDGHPRDAIDPNQTYVYEFRINARAGTYWFHPHPDGTTAEQAYRGLAGLLLVTDDEEAALGLPSGEFDVPLIIQDRTFNSNNQLVYLDDPMSGSDGFLGERILVNGRPNFKLEVAQRIYRLRLLNGSNSRVYKLAWNNQTPLTVIATDGGLLTRPVERRYVTLAPGERIELLADFSKLPVGTRLKLRSLAFDPGDTMGGTPSPLPNGSAFTVMTVEVARHGVETFVIPKKLSTITWPKVTEAVNYASPRQFTISISMGPMMRWLLNGRSFEMEGVTAEETVKLNTTEVWEFTNAASGGMGGMAMMHPIHIHNVQFKVFERRIDPAQASAWETVRHGYVDEGWKDTFLVMPGESVKLLLRFKDYTGLYLYHCHNLEHESQGMMRNYRVQP